MPTTEEREQYQCRRQHPDNPELRCTLYANHPGTQCGDQRGNWWPTPRLHHTPARNTTSNITVGQLIQALSKHPPDAPVLVLFDGGAGVASEVFVQSELTLPPVADPPDWADERTVYLNTFGG